MTEETQAVATVEKKYDDADFTALGLPTPGSLNALKRFAEQAAGTPFFPRGLGSNPTVIWAVMLRGKEDGFAPLQAMAAYWLSPDNRLSMYADSMLAKMRKHGFRFEWHEATGQLCRVTATRPAMNGAGESESYSSQFTIEEASQAGLTGKDNWKKYPQRMLKARVISDIYRYLASDLGGAGMYSAEEIQDLSDAPAGGNGSDREFAEAAADRAAEENPALRLEKKATTTVEATATQVVEDKPKAEEPAEPAKVREPRKPKPAAPAEPVKAPLPEPEPEPVTTAASTEKEEAFASQMALNARASKLLEKIPGSDLLGMGKVYYGYFGSDPGGMPKTWEPYHHVLDLLEPWLEMPGTAPKFVKDPEKFGKVLRQLEEEAKEKQPQAPAPETSTPVEKQEVSESPLAKEFGWGSETVKAATALMGKYKIPIEKIKVSLKTFGLLEVPEDHIRVMFVLWFHSPDAQMVKRRGAEKGLDILQCAAKISERVGSPITLDTDSSKVQTAVLSTLTEIQSL